jgi:uncharacterized protein YtpQ (UPF0354 family)
MPLVIVFAAAALPFVMLAFLGAGPDAPPPSRWAGFFTAGEYRRFLGLVRAHFERKGLPVDISGDVVRAAPDGATAFGLANLAQKCRGEPPDDWADVIAGHFDALDRVEEGLREFEETKKQFSRVRDLLALRLWSREDIDSYAEKNVVFETGLEGIVGLLVYDLPESVESVSGDDLARWGLTREEIFETALDNVRRICAPRIFEDEVAPGATIRVITDDQSLFVATHALLLGSRPDLVGSAGALVAVPNRHALLCCAIESRAVMEAIGRMAVAAARMHELGPGSISPSLYWYHRGRFTDLPCELDGDRLDFSPPDEFVEMLNRLPPADAEGD